MGLRVITSWAVLAGCGCMVITALDPSALAQLLAGLACLGLAVMAGYLGRYGRRG